MRRLSVQSAALLFSTGFCLAAAETSLPTESPDTVLARHIQAAGGKERLEKLKSQVLKAQAQEGERPFSVEISFKEGDKMLLNASSGDGVNIRQGYDGQGHWWRKDPEGVREFSGAKQQMDFSEMSLALSARAMLDVKKYYPELVL